jgi:hypothetical protein
MIRRQPSKVGAATDTNTSTFQRLYDSGMLMRFQIWRGRHRRGISSFGQTCWRAAVEDLYETGQHRLHLIDLLLLARNDLTAKFLDFGILDGRPFTHRHLEQ